MDKPVSTILIVMAMEHEAAPIISKLGFSLLENCGMMGPMKTYSGKVNEGIVYLILNGDSHIYDQSGNVRHKDGDRVKVNRVGVVPAALSTWEGIRLFKPDIILSVGTSGGHKSKGIKQGGVYLSQHPVQYFDRLIDFRAPGDEFDVTNYKCYGIGSHPVIECNQLAKDLGLAFARVGTSSSFAHPEGNIRVQHDENDVAIKEMECAAIAEVADMFSIPFLAVKGVTDYVDVHVTQDDLNSEFNANLCCVSDVVADHTVKVINYILEKKNLKHI
jgi:nucleoside phosphorylase